MPVLVFGVLFAGLAFLLLMWLAVCDLIRVPVLVAPADRDGRGTVVLGHRRRSREFSQSEYAAFLTALGHIQAIGGITPFSAPRDPDDLDAPAAPLRLSPANRSPLSESRPRVARGMTAA